MTSKRRSKGDGALFQRADGTWIGRVELPTLNGRRRRKDVSSKNFAEAARKQRALRREVDEGRIPTTATTTVARWLQHWLTTIHGPTIKPTTYRSYELSVRMHIIPVIGSKRLDRLTPEDVRGMHRELQKTSTRNAQKAHVILQKALKDAVNEGVIARNVAAATAKPKHAKQARTAFTLSVARHIIESSHDEMWAARWALGFLTGARQGEILGLEWSRVDLDNGLLDFAWQLQELQKQHGCGGACGKTRPGWCPQAHWQFPPGFVYREVERSLVLTVPKSEAGTRVVPILPTAAARLARLRDNNPNPHGLVFHHPDGKPITPYQDTKAWKALLEQAGIPHQPLHTMRHSTATILLQAGVDTLVVQSILGHSEIITTQGYQHADVTLKRQAVTALGELLG